MRCFSIIVAFLFCANALAQDQFVAFDPTLTKVEYFGTQAEVTLVFGIEPGYHIQDVQNVDQGLIPTKVIWYDPTLVKSHRFEIPFYETVTLGKDMQTVISNWFKITVRLDLANLEELTGHVYYQACDDKRCFFPREAGFEVSFNDD